jgi:hypothetical protein
LSERESSCFKIYKNILHTIGLSDWRMLRHVYTAYIVQVKDRRVINCSCFQGIIMWYINKL